MSSTKRRVHLLWHTHVLPSGEEDAKLLGVYTSRPRASAAQDRLALQPGFAGSPEGFEISAYTLNQDAWREGFVTLPHTKTGGEAS